MIQDTDWCFATGSVKAMETGLIKQSAWDAIVTSDTPEVLLRRIGDTAYRKYFNTDSDLEGREDILDKIHRRQIVHGDIQADRSVFRD